MSINLDFGSRWNVIKSVLSIKIYMAIFLIILVSYFGFNFWINQFYETLPVFFSFRLSFVLPYAMLTLLIGITVALNLTLVGYKFKQMAGLKSQASNAGLSAFGAFGGMLGGACPGCFVGLLPSLAGVFGVTVTLSSLPYKGFEIQIPTLIITAAALYIIAKPLSCAIK